MLLSKNKNAASRNSKYFRFIFVLKKNRKPSGHTGNLSPNAWFLHGFSASAGNFPENLA
jgi:hypothetical protein